MINLHAGSYEILAALAPTAESYLGIGVQEGICAEHVAKANPTIAMVLCDTWGREHGGTGRGSHDHVEDRLVATGHTGVRYYLDGLSQVEVPKLTAHFDLIYVDGSHEEAAAFDDLVNSWAHLQIAGVMVVHDVKMAPVWIALLRFLDLRVEDAIVTLHVGGHGTAVVRHV